MLSPSVITHVMLSLGYQGGWAGVRSSTYFVQFAARASKPPSMPMPAETSFHTRSRVTTRIYPVVVLVVSAAPDDAVEEENSPGPRLALVLAAATESVATSRSVNGRVLERRRDELTPSGAAIESNSCHQLPALACRGPVSPLCLQSGAPARRYTCDRGYAGGPASLNILGAVRRHGLWFREGCGIGTFIGSVATAAAIEIGSVTKSGFTRMFPGRRVARCLGCP